MYTNLSEINELISLSENEKYSQNVINVNRAQKLKRE